jgi:16S rRNA G1207 methylase RsmC
MIESMVLPEKGVILDLGCGYGPIGIAASVFDPSLHVVMTDTNLRAVKLARINAKRNHVSNIKVFPGWLYDPVDEMVFDSILSNPPLAAGFKKVIIPLVEGAYTHLNPGGSIQLVVRKSSGGRKIYDLMFSVFGSVETIARGGGYRILLSRRDRQSAVGSHSQA